MHPSEFCRKWVPLLRDYREGEYGFGVECGIVVSSITGAKQSSVYKWLRGTQEPPLYARIILGLVDLLLESDQETIESFKRSLRESLSADGCDPPSGQDP
jgi:hypothetical protein